MIQLLIDAVKSVQPVFLRKGVVLELSVPETPSPKPAARLDASSSRGLAQLILWITGEADLVIADLATGDVVVNEHREITSDLGIQDILDTIESHLGNDAEQMP
jgi:hypothetical protein